MNAVAYALLAFEKVNFGNKDIYSCSLQRRIRILFDILFHNIFLLHYVVYFAV